MRQTEIAQKLTIYTNENDRYKGHPFYEYIVHKAKNHKMAGVTVLRGMVSFGAHHKIHNFKILALSDNLPIVIEMIDSEEKINSFLDHVEPAIKSGMITIQEVKAIFYHNDEKS